MDHSKNIHPYSYRIAPSHREKLLEQQARLIWFTGLSGSGKSTLANALEHKLHDLRYKTFVLDGDQIRHGINKHLGFSREDRIENLRRVAEIAALFLDAGIIAIGSFISPMRSDREMVRQICGTGRFLEIYVNTSLEVCESRDPKGLYQKARKGEIAHFTGISAPYEAPLNPDLVVDTSLHSPEICAGQILDFVLQHVAL